MNQANYNCIKKSERNVIIPVYEDGENGNKIGEVLGYDVNSIIDYSFKKVTKVFTLGKFPFKYILFLGLGKKAEMTTARLREAFAFVANQIDEPASFMAKTAICDQADLNKVCELFALTYEISVYEECKVGKEAKISCDVNVMADEDVSMALLKGSNDAAGVNYARDLGNTPANHMTPKELVKEAKMLAECYDLECTILDKKALEEMHAGGILAVNQGSEEPPYMICLKYQGADDEPYTALIGKGITFDSGGYNIKSNSFGMKYDMCGAADVLGAMKIIASNKMKCNVYCIVPATENLINGKAYKPQDVIETMSGKTVEIVSTDAEGRLILCDAITYAQTLENVTKMIDVATLTGACVGALGDVFTGVFANSDRFYDEFMESMKANDERGWRLPLDDAYMKKIASKSADMKNSSGKVGGGASIAAGFLNAFVHEGVEWIHLDIAGVSDNETGATGRIVLSLANLYR